MYKKIRLGISIKLAASFVFFAIVIISTIGYLNYTVSFDIMDTTIHADLEERVVSIKTQMDNLYEEEVDDASIHANNPSIMEYTLALLDNKSIDAYSKLKNELDAYVLRDDEVSAVFIMDAVDGRVIISTDPLYSDVQMSNRSYFIDGKLFPFVSVHKFCPIENTIISTASAPMYHNGSVVAVVGMRLDDSEFINSINEIPEIGTTENAYIIDQFGVIINNGPNEIDSQVVTSEGIKRGFADGSGVLEYTSHTGIPVVGAYRWVPEYNSLILVERDLAEVHAPMEELLERNIMVAIPLFIILFVFIVLFTNYLTKPIIALSKGMKNVESGDYSTSIEPMYNDELGDLTLSFNGMAEKLQRTIGEQESIFRSAGAGIMLVNLDTTILRVNDWILERFGHIIGVSASDLISKDLICNECPAGFTIKSNTSATVKMVQIDDGLEHTYHMTTSPVYDSNGIEISAVLVLTDITERLQMENELRQYSTKLESMVENKTKTLTDKLAEIEKMNDIFVDRELVHIETKVKLSELRAKHQRLEQELMQMRGDAK